MNGDTATYKHGDHLTPQSSSDPDESQLLLLLLLLLEIVRG